MPPQGTAKRVTSPGAKVISNVTKAATTTGSISPSQQRAAEAAGLGYLTDNLQNSAAPPSAGPCETGGNQPTTEGAATGEQAGSEPTDDFVSANGKAGRNRPVESNLQKAIGKSAGENNAYFVATSGGNPTPGAIGSFRHNYGLAADGHFVDRSTGRTLNANNSADRSKLSNIMCSASKNGIRGFGWGNGYMGGSTFHLDGHGAPGSKGSQSLVWGAGGRSANAAPWLKDTVGKCAPGSAPLANSGQGGPGDNGAYDACNPSDGGCQPISSSAPGAAASMMQGQGMGVPAALSGPLSALMSGDMGALQGAVQSAASSALGGVTALAQGGLTNIASQITGPVFSQLQNIGGSILPSLTGVIPSLLSGGGLQGMLTGAIQGVAGNIISQGAPMLGNFSGILNSAIGAAAGGANLQQALMSSVTQVFGKGTGLNLDSINGFIPDNLTNAVEEINSILGGNYNEEIEGMDGINAILSGKLKNRVALNGSFNETLKDLTTKPVIDAFSSAFMDYNSMVTQGLGELSDNLTDLGRDLKDLGKLGDLKDLLNVGTPGQLARQLIENGIGISTGLTFALVDNGINVSNVFLEEHQDKVYEILSNINDEKSISLVKQTFNISDSVNLKNVSNLLDPKTIFTRSYEYNRFENLRDITLTLVSCGGTGRLETLGDLGSVMARMETAEGFDELLDDVSVIRPDEIDSLVSMMPVDSYFGSKGPVLADFIGTAVGYVHADTLPRMKTLLEEMYNSSETDNFYDLMELLTATLNGDYLVIGSPPATDTIVVPATAGYSGGTYTSLDDAVIDIKNAIENELNYILENYIDNEDKESFYQKLLELESLHEKSAGYLAHEQRMRQAYGIDIGEDRQTILYFGDGSTISFPLNSANGKNAIVYINGVYQILEENNYSYDANTNSIIFSTPPSSGSKISIIVETEKSFGNSNPQDIWQLASNLENLALETGYGKPADFLNRIATNDRHGQRIRSIMIQARNKDKLDTYGMTCPGFNRILNNVVDGDTTLINWVDQTGIWAPNPDRAAEIWLQNTQEVDETQQYVLERIKENSNRIKPDLDLLIQNTTRRLIFYVNGNLVMSDLMTSIYTENNNNLIYNNNRNDLAIGYNNDLPTEGYILGPYKEILSELMREENLPNDIFNIPLSITTDTYLKDIGIDMSMLTTILQRVLNVNTSLYYGITEGDFQAIFGIQSVSKAILSNIANNY